jgi:hypothetical protein
MNILLFTMICSACRKHFEEIIINDKSLKTCNSCRETNRKYRLANSNKIKQYYLENAIKIKNRSNKYRLENSNIKKERKYSLENSYKIKKYYQENSNKIKEKQKKYRLENSDKIKVKNRNYQIANSDKIKEKKQQYCKDNAVKIKERNLQYRLLNSDKIKERNKCLTYGCNKYKDYTYSNKYCRSCYYQTITYCKLEIIKEQDLYDFLISSFLI